jgi:hypothetical protein
MNPSEFMSVDELDEIDIQDEIDKLDGIDLIEFDEHVTSLVLDDLDDIPY